MGKEWGKNQASPPSSVYLKNKNSTKEENIPDNNNTKNSIVRKYDKCRFCINVHTQYKNGSICTPFFCRPKIFQLLLCISEHILNSSSTPINKF
jgi:hypothetical protein